jgi:protein TonB
MNIQSADLRAHSIARRNPQTRLLTIGIVGAIHIVAITAIMNGLIPLKAIIPPLAPLDYVDVKTPKPPHPQPPTNIESTFIKPEGPVVREPDVPIQRDDPGPIFVNRDPVKPQPLSATAAIGIGATHTLPPYPELAIRLRQNGIVTLRIALGADGSIGDVRIEKSSGSSLLDDAAVAWVKTHWRYRPATENGTPVASTALAAVRFDLKQAH